MGLSFLDFAPGKIAVLFWKHYRQLRAAETGKISLPQRYAPNWLSSIK